MISVLRNVRSFSFWKSPQTWPGNYERLKPHENDNFVDQILSAIPKHIQTPDYYQNNKKLQEKKNQIESPVIWTDQEIAKVRKTCRITRKVLHKLRDLIEPGVTTKSINDEAHKLIVGYGGYPSQLNFHGFPKSISLSVNNVAVHGIPDDRPLKNGDIVSLDVTVFHDGYHGDCTETFLVGENHGCATRNLQSVAKECLYKGISACEPGALFLDIGDAIHKLTKKRNVNVIPNLCGHGIGSFFHGPPDIYHTLNNYPGTMLPGMIFTIEPCITEGNSGKIEIWPDGLTVATGDGARTAQCEHTILITDTGVEILTA